jgi:hypothetical protein
MEALYPFTRDALDALQAHVAVLDEAGRVIEVNKRWRRFGKQNGASSDYVGFNYLEVCAPAAKAGDRRAQRVMKGLRSLLTGEADHFGLAYHCAERTFRLRARRVNEAPVRVFVAHEDITAILRARRERDHAHQGLAEAQREHAIRLDEAYEELGQRLAAITLATQVIERVGIATAAVATIRLAVDEARREVRLLRYEASAANDPAEQQQAAGR